MGKFSQNNLKLTNGDVYAIREKYATGNYSYGRLAREYGVVSETIGRIVRQETRNRVAVPIEKVDVEEMAERFRQLQMKLNSEAQKLPIAKEIAASKQLDSLLDPDRAAKFGAKLP